MKIGGSEKKRLNILKRQGFIIYSINFEQHNADYDLHNSEKTVDEFMVSDQIVVQCTFSVTNYQPPQDEFFTEVIDQRSCLTDVYPCRYFNEFVQ